MNENSIKEEPQSINDFKVEKQDLSLSSYICTKLSPQNRNQQHTCEYCRAIFKTKSELEVHIDDIHMGGQQSFQDLRPGPSKIESNDCTVSQNL